MEVTLKGQQTNTFNSNTPLSRVLRGTALPEDTLMARSQFSAGIGRLSHDPICRTQAEGLLRVVRGSTSIEDVVIGRSAINDIFRPIR